MCKWKKNLPSIITLLKEIELRDNRKASVVIACSTKSWYGGEYELLNELI